MWLMFDKHDSLHRHRKSLYNLCMRHEREKWKRLTRRELLAQAACACALLPFAGSTILGHTQKKGKQEPQHAAPTNPSPFFQVDEALLEEMENANFHFFWEQANPETGIVRDRCNATKPDKSDLGSIASTGFGLTALCIGDQRGYVSHNDARNRALNTMRFLWKKLPSHRGFFYHWANVNTGERLWDSEVSSVDTAILLCGILMCRRISSIPRSASWRWKYSTGWIGPGFQRTPEFSRTAGLRKTVSCNTAGTITAR